MAICIESSKIVWQPESSRVCHMICNPLWSRMCWLNWCISWGLGCQSTNGWQNTCTEPLCLLFELPAYIFITKSVTLKTKSKIKNKSSVAICSYDISMFSCNSQIITIFYKYNLLRIHMCKMSVPEYYIKKHYWGHINEANENKVLSYC